MTPTLQDTATAESLQAICSRDRATFAKRAAKLKMGATCHLAGQEFPNSLTDTFCTPPILPCIRLHAQFGWAKLLGSCLPTPADASAVADD